MVEFALLIGPVWLQVRNSQLMIGVSHNTPLPDGMMPRLHGGQRADHLSIPLEPRSKGKHAGRIWIHLKYPDGHREEIATPSPEELQNFFARVQEYVEARFLRSVSRVIPTELSTKGYQLLVYDEDFIKVLDATFKTSKPTAYRVSRSRIDRMVDGAWLVGTDVLEHLELDELPKEPLVAACFEEETSGAPNLFLKYYTQGPDGNCPGWFAWPTTWLPQDFIAELLNQHVGAPIWEFLKTIANELGLDLDMTKLEQMIAQADAAQRRMPPTSPR